MTVDLEVHGITQEAAEVAGLLFGPPRIYWNGSWTYQLAPNGDGETCSG